MKRRAAFAVMAGLAAAPVLADDLGGGVTLTIKRHASFVLEWQGVAIYVDPSRGPGGDPFAGTPPPDLILVTRGSLEHLDIDKIREAITPNTLLAAPLSLIDRRIRDTLGFEVGCRFEMMAQFFHCPPEGWERRGVSPGETFAFRGVGIEVLAGGNAGDAHGCCVSYVVTLGAMRIYIAGETDANPDMLALRRIDVAFLPLRPSSTFGAVEAAAAIAAFRPRVVYPYTYLRGDDPALFAVLVGPLAEVRIRDWYAGAWLHPDF